MTRSGNEVRRKEMQDEGQEAPISVEAISSPSMSQSMPSKPAQPLRATVPSFHFFHIAYDAAELLQE